MLRNSSDETPWLSSRDWVLALALVLATVLAYHPVWRAGFIWDDDVYVTRNPLLTAPDGLQRIWFSFDSPSQYFPLTYTTFYLERIFWSLHPEGYHCINILLHAANALLAWRLLARLRVPGAWLAAALFALHPVQVESVAWITERKNLLMVFFFLLALLAWTKFIDETTKRPWRFYVLALVLCVLALSAKTTACTLPAALVLLLWLNKVPIGLRRLAQIVPFLALGVCMGLVTIWWERFHQHTHGGVFSIGLLDRLLIASRNLWFYAGKILWPTNLTFSYPRWKITTADPVAYGWLLATVALGVVIWRAREWLGRGMGVALVFYAATLSPVLGFIMLYTFRYSFVADHYQYLACLGPLALVAAGIERGLSWVAGRTPFPKPMGYTVVLAILGGLTWVQCEQYVDIETLWRATVARNPSSWMAHDNLANVLGQKGKVVAAIAEYRKALELQPDYAEAHNDLGNALKDQGEMAEAMAHYYKALELQPDFAKAHYNLGNALIKQGKVVEAIAQYRIAVKLRPEDISMNINLANAIFTLGHLDEAIAQYRQILSIAPDDARVNKNLGKLLLLKGDYDGAMSCFQKALPMSPDPVERWYNLGNDLLESGDYKQAIGCYRKALSIEPRSADAQANLGLAFLQNGQAREAIDCWQQALAIKPDLPKVQNRLAWLLATASDESLRNGAKAVALAEQANQLTGGGNPIIQCTLAAAYAETGRYDKATAIAQKALEQAKAQKNDGLTGALEKEIKLFEAGLPMRESK